MKLLISVFILFVSIIICDYDAFALAAIKSDTNTYYQKYIPEIEDCDGDGCSCCITQYPSFFNGGLTPVSGGRMIDLPLSSLIKECKLLEESGSFTKCLNVNNYTFKAGSQLRIISCDEDPSLVGLILNIGGMTTDNNGVLHYFIPF